MPVKKKKDTSVERALQRAMLMSSALARKSQLFAALKPVLNELLHIGTIVDVGCGIATPADYLSGHYDRYIGIDTSDAMVEAARLYNRGNNKVHFISGDITTIDMPQHSADLIIAIGSIHHISNPEKVIDAIIKVGRPQAHLVIIEPQHNSPIGMAIRTVRKLLDDGYVGNQVYYSEDYLRRILLERKVTNLTVSYQGFLSPTFAQMRLNPQLLFVPLSLYSIVADGLLKTILPRFVQKAAANIIIHCKLPG